MTSTKTLNDTIKKALKEVKSKIKKMVEAKTAKGAIIITDVPAGSIDMNVLKAAASKKAELDIAISKAKAIDAEYQPLRTQVLEQLPGDVKDKVEVLIDGIQIKKTSRTTGAGSIDQVKMMELARQKKILSKVTTTVKVIDEEAILMYLHDGVITYEEYMSCLKEGNTTPVIDIEYKAAPQAVVEEDNKDAAV